MEDDGWEEMDGWRWMRNGWEEMDEEWMGGDG